MWQFGEPAYYFTRPIARAKHKEAVFDVSSGVRYSYGQLWERSERLAAYLVNELGIAKGDVIAFCADTGIHYLDAFYASLRIGAIITVYNCHLSGADLQALVEAEKPKVIIFQEKYRKSVNDFLTTASFDCTRISLDADRDCPYQTIMEYEGVIPSTVGWPGMEDIQMLVHTGGTTGHPKSAMMSFRAILANAISEIVTLELTSRDCALVYFPFFHTAGWNVMTLPLLLLGGRVVIGCPLKSNNLLDAIEQEHPTVGIANETLFIRMANDPSFATRDFSSYRFIINGSSPISKANMKPYWNKGIKLINAYGMTEIGPNNACPPVNEMSLDEVIQRCDSIGFPMFLNQMRIVDAQGNDCDPMVHGELLWRGSLTFSGYWNNPKETSETVSADGWVHSGDMGYIDNDGYVYLSGRLKNLIISGGENIFPIEIENMYKQHPQIADCSVIAVPDPTWGEVPKALVVPVAGATLSCQKVIAYGKANLPTIKVPRYVTFLEELPRNGLKVDLSSLKKKYGFAGN